MLYEAFPAVDTRRVLAAFGVPRAPKYASWVKILEIEIGVLRGQCLDRRTGKRERLVSEFAGRGRQRNAAAARFKWMFT